MYERILNEKLRFPNQVSEKARSLISQVRPPASLSPSSLAAFRPSPPPGSGLPGVDTDPPAPPAPPPLLLPPMRIVVDGRTTGPQLLERDPTKRLGACGEDMKEIARHPFFEGIDWDKLYNRGYEPPFNPNVVRRRALTHSRGGRGRCDRGVDAASRGGCAYAGEPWTTCAEWRHGPFQYRPAVYQRDDPTVAGRREQL